MHKALSAILLFFPAAAGASQPSNALRRASRDVRDALLNAHILMSSAQAALVELQWDINRWKLPVQKAKAAEDCDRISLKLKEFREKAEAVDAQTNPLQPYIDELMKSKDVQKASSGIPASLSAQVEEIKRIRSGYDGDASRSALIRARSAWERSRPASGAPALLPEQEHVILLAKDFLEDIRGTRIRLAAGAKAARKTAGKGLPQLEADATDLSTEIERLRLHFILDNYFTGKGADLRDSPSAKADADGADQLSDPDMVGEMRQAEEANLRTALARGSAEELQSAQNAWLLLCDSRNLLYGAPWDIPSSVSATAASKQAEDLADSLTLSGQMLKAKAALFRQRAASAALRLTDIPAADLTARRAGYPSKDRQRDLAKARSYLDKLKDSAPPAPGQAAALDALRDCIFELRSARLALGNAQTNLKARNADAAKKLVLRGAQLDSDIDDLKREAELLEVSFRLARQDEKAFDARKGR